MCLAECLKQEGKTDYKKENKRKHLCQMVLCAIERNSRLRRVVSAWRDGAL